MDIYKYNININNKLGCEKMEGYCDSAKTYTRGTWPRRILKEHIGKVVNAHIKPVLYLIQRDDARAREIFTEYYQRMVQATKDKCQKDIAAYDAIIQELTISS